MKLTISQSPEHLTCYVYRITGVDLELLAGCLEKAQLSPYWHGDELILEEDKPKDAIANFIQAFYQLRGVEIEVVDLTR